MDNELLNIYSGQKDYAPTDNVGDSNSSTSLLNTNTNEVEKVDNSLVQKYVWDGTHKVLPDTQVFMSTPDGKTEWHNTNDWDTLINSGYHIASPSQVIAAREYKAKKDYFQSSTVESAKAALEAVARGVTLNLSTPFEKGVGIDPENIKLRKETNPFIAPASEFIGTLAVMLASGGRVGTAKAAALAEEVGGVANAVKEATQVGDAVKSATQAVSQAPTMARQALNYAKVLNDKLPVNLLTKGAQSVEEMLGGGALARIGTQAGMGSLWSASNYFTEAALGDPNEAAQHVVGNLTLGALLGGGLQGIGEVGSKAFSLLGTAGKKADELARPMLNKMWDADSGVISKQLDEINKLHSLDFAKDLEVGIKGIAKEADEATITAIRKDLVAKYPKSKDIINSNITASTSLKDIPVIQRKLLDSMTEKKKALLDMMNNPNAKTLEPALVEINNNIQIGMDTQDAITKYYEDSLNSLYKQLSEIGASTTPRNEFINKLTSEQLINLKNDLEENLGILIRANNNKIPKGNETLVENLEKVNIAMNKPPVIDKTIHSIDDNLANGIKVAPENKAVLSQGARDIGNDISSLKNKIYNEGGYNKTLEDQINAIDKIFNTGDEAGVPGKLGIHKEIENDNMKNVFVSLHEQKRNLGILTYAMKKAKAGDKVWSQKDIDLSGRLTNLLNNYDTILKDASLFGKVTDDYTLFNTNYSALSQGQKWARILYIKLPGIPSKTEGMINIRGEWYKPNYNRIKGAVEGTDAKASQALQEIPEYYLKAMTAYSVHPNKDVLSVVIPDKDALIDSLRQLKDLTNLSKTGHIMRDTDILKAGSKYGLMGTMAYAVGVPLPVISGMAGIMGTGKLLMRNPSMYINWIDRTASAFHKADKLIYNTMKNKLLRGVEGYVVSKAATKLTEEDSAKKYDVVRKQLDSYKNPQKRAAAINYTNDLNSNITPNLSEAYVVQMNRAIDFLLSKQPKESKIFSFIDTDKNSIISDSEKRKFMEVYKYANDPNELLNDFPYITNQAVNTVKTIYPAKYNQIIKTVVDLYPQMKKITLTKDQKHGLSVLMGMDIQNVNSGSLFKNIQQSFNQPPEDQQQPKVDPKTAVKASERMTLQKNVELE